MSVEHSEGHDDLDRLAGLAGIEPSYRDYYGRETTVSVETKLAFLRALGFAVESASEITASLAAFEDRSWLRASEPVIVATRGPRSVCLAVSLPADRARTLPWRVVEENGRAHEGSVKFAALPLTATRSIGGLPYERRMLRLALALPAGYHRIVVDDAQGALIVAPPRCYLPRTIARGTKVWGIAIQLYALRSRRDWGVGDFGDLLALARVATRAGASIIGVNPLHELDPADPDACSPYSPSSRLFLNTAYLDVQAIPDFAESEEANQLVAGAAFAGALAADRGAPLVDYAGAAARKRPVLEAMYASFRRAHLVRESDRGRAFRTFVTEGGEALARLATFEALREHFASERPNEVGWANWPAEFRDSESAAVARFAADRRDRVEFFAYLQWNADLQLATAARACAKPIGLYRDLAVGAAASGAEAWSEQRALLGGVCIGAPPDPLNAHGQNWGLAPPNPLELRERGYEPFVRLVRANMRHAGALRIDHVMALQRLFWIPIGSTPSDGAYVRYAYDDLIAIVALESERNRCLVVGEDLGTVPEGLRERLHGARTLSTKVLYFEREYDGAYRPPAAYPSLALASPGTHDLPTLPAFWTGRDLDVRAALGLLPPGLSIGDALAGRAHEREQLVSALVADGDLAADVADRLRAGGVGPADVGVAVLAAYRYLARSAAQLLIAPLEDVLEVFDQINVPGTTWQHPNWRLRLGTAVEDLAEDPRFSTFTGMLRTFRARPPRRPARSPNKRR